jgi:hypothetical protein
VDGKPIAHCRFRFIDLDQTPRFRRPKFALTARRNSSRFSSMTAAMLLSVIRRLPANLRMEQTRPMQSETVQELIPALI